jgi:hypothetical protein
MAYCGFAINAIEPSGVILTLALAASNTQLTGGKAGGSGKP